jgi:hypothetical protein
MSLQLLTRNPSLHSKQDEKIGGAVVVCAVDVGVFEFLVVAAFIDEQARKKEIIVLGFMVC